MACRRYAPAKLSRRNRRAWPSAEIERRVPAGEAPPLPPNAQLALIGKSIPRINGRAKVTGAAPFTVDVKLPGMLYARLLRSPSPHARVMSIDIGPRNGILGCVPIHVINDVVGRPSRRPDRIRLPGQAVVAFSMLAIRSPRSPPSRRRRRRQRWISSKSIISHLHSWSISRMHASPTRHAFSTHPVTW